MRGATRRDGNGLWTRLISIHAPHAGSDPQGNAARCCEYAFQSTLPMRGATFGSDRLGRLVHISIHAPHAGSDSACSRDASKPSNFNPRSPCGERPLPGPARDAPRRFQSTLPMRGATSPCRPAPPSRPYFNPRSPCGERPARVFLLAESASISIHAPHAGSDQTGKGCLGSRSNFNPRSPCGERLSEAIASAVSCIFQSTLPMRGATHVHVGGHRARDISIHAPHAGSDAVRGSAWRGGAISIHAPHAGSDDPGKPEAPGARHFNPRSPCGERPSGGMPWHRRCQFQSTLPMRGATDVLHPWTTLVAFQSTLPMRGATTVFPRMAIGDDISIHAPHAGSDVVAIQR